MPLTINIIGTGKLGATIGRLVTSKKLATIQAVYNRTLENSKRSSAFIGEGAICSNLHELPAANIYLITTPDSSISDICEILCHNKYLPQESIAIHCSGQLTSDVLLPLKIQKKCFVASIHPMHSFVDPLISSQTYDKTYCAIEGDNQAIDIIQPLFEAFGSDVFKIDKNNKVQYHAAGIFASNYIVTLANSALLCLEEAQVPEDLAMHIITTLMHNTVNNLKNTLSPAKSLTGPIQRGDINTIKAHLSALSTTKQKQLYSILGDLTIDLTDHQILAKNTLSDILSL